MFLFLVRWMGGSKEYLTCQPGIDPLWLICFLVFAPVRIQASAGDWEAWKKWTKSSLSWENTIQVPKECSHSSSPQVEVTVSYQSPGFLSSLTCPHVLPTGLGPLLMDTPDASVADSIPLWPLPSFFFCLRNLLLWPCSQFSPFKASLSSLLQPLA